MQFSRCIPRCVLLSKSLFSPLARFQLLALGSLSPGSSSSCSWRQPLPRFQCETRATRRKFSRCAFCASLHLLNMSVLSRLVRFLLLAPRSLSPGSPSSCRCKPLGSGAISHTPRKFEASVPEVPQHVYSTSRAISLLVERRAIRHKFPDKRHCIRLNLSLLFDDFAHHTSERQPRKFFIMFTAPAARFHCRAIRHDFATCLAAPGSTCLRVLPRAGLELDASQPQPRKSLNMFTAPWPRDFETSLTASALTCLRVSVARSEKNSAKIFTTSRQKVGTKYEHKDK